MPYSRAGANKHYGFGALGKLQGSRIPIFVIDEWIALLLLLASKHLYLYGSNVLTGNIGLVRLRFIFLSYGYTVLAEKRVQKGCVHRQSYYCGIIDVGLQWACGGYLYRRAGRIYAEQGFDKIRHNAQLFDRCVNCVWLVPV